MLTLVLSLLVLARTAPAVPAAPSPWLAADCGAVSGLAQDPVQASASVAPPHDAFAVTGTPELDSAAAFRAAMTQAEAKVRDAQRERALLVAAEWRPFWLPPVFVEQAVTRWVQAPQRTTGLCIVDRTDQRREHEFGSSYQTTLWVREDAAALTRGERELRQQFAQLRLRTLATSGGTVVFWALLTLAVGWLDRLSRGYMTVRLRLLGLVLGSAVPAVAFVL